MMKVKLVDVFKKLSPVLKQFQNRFLLGILLIFVSTVIEMIMPYVIGKSVDFATGIVETSGKKDFAPLLNICLLYLMLIVVRSILETIQAYVIQSTGQGVTHHLRVILFKKIGSLPISYFDKNPTGRLLTRVVNDIKSLSELFTASFSVLALDAMIIMGTVGTMFWINAKLAGAVLITFPVVVFTIYFFGEKLAIAYRKVRTKLAEINGFLGENIGAIATIQRLAAEEERCSRFEKIVSEHKDAQMESLKVFAMVQPWANILNGIAMSTLIGVGGIAVIRGEISLGILVAFFGYLRNIFQPIRDLVEKYNTFLSAMVSAERVIGILDVKSEPDQSHETAIVKGECGIKFRNVSFQYLDRLKPVLENVSFEISSGKSLAIVGSTGSGKSTLIRLLLRFYEPKDGKILFGERELNTWDVKTLRSQIGVVHQEIYLFGGTIRDNLTLGRNGFTDVFLIEQCQRAELWDFISFRGGIDMIVYEGGINLSIGERQLLSLARILVINPPVLVLDEATASVDALIERRLMNALKETLCMRTSIVIAHRLSTIEHCDQILVLEKGRVVEFGTYEKLLGQNGLFAKFHEIHSHA